MSIELRRDGAHFSTTAYEWTPSLSPDGRYLFYAHLVGSDPGIYQIELEALLEME
jgi:hypothetical protein